MSSATGLITLADARVALRPHVNGGNCDQDTIDDVIAEVEERLHSEGDWRLSHRRVRVLVRNTEFSLPLTVMKICAANVDGTPAAVGSRAVEWSSAYAGDIDLISQTARNVIDNGEHPTQYDIPAQRLSDSAWSPGLKLIAFSTHPDDTAVPLTVRGFKANNDEIFTETAGVMTPGEAVAINRWHMGIEGQVSNMDLQVKSVSDFKSISQVYKAVTKAPVTLFAYDGATKAMYFLSKMEPRATIPSYRRYRLTGMTAPVVESDLSITKDCASALLLVKLAWVRAAYADDVLFIQNMAALKFGAQAVALENAGQYDGSLNAWALAIKVLKTQRRDQNGEVTMPMIIDVGESASLSSVNHGYLV